MSNTSSASAALPIAHVALRILIIVNWVGGAAILALLVALPNEQWIMRAFTLAPSPDTDRLILGLQTVATLGIGVVVLHYVVLKRLLAIVDTVRAGDPFGIRDSGFGIRHSAFGIRDSGFGIRDSGFGIRDARLTSPALIVLILGSHEFL